MRIVLSTALLVVTQMCCCYSMADMAIQNPQAFPAINLDGHWDSIIDPYENGYYNHRYEESKNGYFMNAKPKNPSDLVEYDFSRSPKLNVPGDWNTQDDKLFFYEGTIWYHRDVEINTQSDLEYILYFGAVNYHATVYVNGKKVGIHEGGFTPFQFNVSSLVHTGNNSIVVKVDNRRERDQIPTVNTDWWNYGGITRSVKLLTIPHQHIDDYLVQLSPARTDRIEGWVNVSNITNQADNTVRPEYVEGPCSDQKMFRQAQHEWKSEKTNCHVNSNDGNNHQQVELRILELGIKQQITLDNTGHGKFSVNAKPALWQPDRPKLYAIELRYQDELVNDAIGFRHIAVEGENILLNGKSIYLKGISMHEESPLHPGRAWSDEDAQQLLIWAKELGCNYVRLAHYPHNEAMLRMADKMGLMVWSEIPVYWTVLFDHADVYAKAEAQLNEMIQRDKNRASVVLWSVANETPNTPERLKFLTNLINKARTMDSSRLITAAMDTQDDSHGAKVIDDPLALQIDVIGINTYCGWYSGTPDSCASLQWLSHYHKPAIISEFGADALQGFHGDRQ